MFFVKQFFPGADRDFEPVLERRQWTGPILVISAIWIVGHIEINQESPAGQRLGFKVAARRIGFLARQRIDERQKDPFGPS